MGAKSLLGVVVCTVLLSSVVSAVGLEEMLETFLTTPGYEVPESELNVVNDQYLSNLPDVLKSLFGNEKINLEVAIDQAGLDALGNPEVGVSAGDTVVIGLELSDGRITRAVSGGVDPTMKVFVDLSTAVELASSSDPVSELQNALGSGKIRYESVGGGIVDVVKNTIFGLISFILSFFG